MGDVIVEIDGQEIKSQSDLVQHIKEKKESVVNLTIIRNKTRSSDRKFFSFNGNFVNKKCKT